MQSNLPDHVAIIMDGNGRWAESRGLPKYKGHEAGMDAMVKVVRHAADIGMKHITVYAFSTENWKRSNEEVKGIFQLLLIYVNRELEEMHRKNIKVDIYGDWTPFSKTTVNALNKTIRKTSANTGLRFHICLNYGGRAELLRAAKMMADEDCSDYSEAEFEKRLYTEGVPDPDLLIRPGGEKRVSNFLLWQTAYTELLFSDILWPDYSISDFDSALEEYRARKRRFGGRE